MEEIGELRQRVAQEEELKKGERKGASGTAEEQDIKMDAGEAKEPAQTGTQSDVKEEPTQQNGGRMDVDDENTAPKQEVKQDAVKTDSKDTPATTLIQATAGDEDDAVEY